MCRVYGVTRAGFYASLERGCSAQAIENAALLKRVREIHQASKETYGSPRITAALKEEGRSAGRQHDVARRWGQWQVAGQVFLHRR